MKRDDVLRIYCINIREIKSDRDFSTLMYKMESGYYIKRLALRSSDTLGELGLIIRDNLDKHIHIYDNEIHAIDLYKEFLSDVRITFHLIDFDIKGEDGLFYVTSLCGEVFKNRTEN